jgi:hypothetical protein
MAAPTGTDLFIGWIFCFAIGIANRDSGYAINTGKVGLDAPKAPAGQPDLF